MIRRRVSAGEASPGCCPLYQEPHSRPQPLPHHDKSQCSSTFSIARYFMFSPRNDAPFTRGVVTINVSWRRVGRCGFWPSERRGSLMRGNGASLFERAWPRLPPRGGKCRSCPLARSRPNRAVQMRGAATTSTGSPAAAISQQRRLAACPPYLRMAFSVARELRQRGHPITMG